MKITAINMGGEKVELRIGSPIHGRHFRSVIIESMGEPNPLISESQVERQAAWQWMGQLLSCRLLSKRKLSKP